MKKLLLAFVAIALIPSAASAETRGEAFLRYVWGHIEPSAAIYQLGAMNDQGFQQASYTLLSQGVEWCDRAEQNIVLEQTAIAAYQDVSNTGSPDARATLYVFHGARQYLCPEYSAAFDSAMDAALSTVDH